jgi:hypothetical protein
MMRLEAYLDDAPEPVQTGAPPFRLDLDTAALEDGPHTLRIVVVDEAGRQTTRTLPFQVRNGPAIDVQGLPQDGPVQGKVSVMLNAYGSHYREWDVGTAESPRAVPAWLWIIIIAILAWATYYGVSQWSPPPAFANGPPYGMVGSPAPGR